MEIWAFLLFSLVAQAGLECHETDINKTTAALKAVSASECKESDKIKAADLQLRDLGLESQCNPDLVNQAKRIIADLRIDAWMNNNTEDCQRRVKEGLAIINKLKPSPK